MGKGKTKKKNKTTKLNRRRKFIDHKGSADKDQQNEEFEIKEMRKKVENHINKSKKEVRKKKKLKKLVAYLQVATSNDEDRVKRKLQPPQQILTSSDTAPILPLNFASLKKVNLEIKARRDKIKNQTCFYLTDKGRSAAFNLFPSPEKLEPLFVKDIQHLLLNAVVHTRPPVFPSWCGFRRQSKLSHILILFVHGLSVTNFRFNIDVLTNLVNLFNHKVEVVSPNIYGKTLMKEFYWMSLSNIELNKIISDLKVREEAIIQGNVVLKDEASKLQALRSISKAACTKTSLLLNTQQMRMEKVPFPGDLAHDGTPLVPTKDVYKNVTDNSPMFGLDCEMCYTTNELNELTRVSIVNEKRESIYDTLVKPKAPITDYLTQYSGITPNMLQDVTVQIEDVQKKIREILPADAILIGQSLSSDLTALQMTHPYIIDTSVIYNLTGIGHRKTKLKKLSQIFLNEEIQCHGAKGHDSIEDSASALKLVQLKLAKGIHFGDVRWTTDYAEEYPEHEEEPSSSSCALNILHFIEKGKKRIAVVQNGEPTFSTDEFLGYKDCSFLNIFNTSSNSNMAAQIESITTNFDVTCGHLVFPSSGIHLVREFDEIIKRIYDSCASNSLVVVLSEGMGNVSGYENGLCFVKERRKADLISAVSVSMQKLYSFVMEPM